MYACAMLYVAMRDILTAAFIWKKKMIFKYGLRKPELYEQKLTTDGD